MFRLIGFVIGSAASIGAIVLLLGIPEFHLSNPQLDKDRFDEALLKLREKKQTVNAAARQAAEQVSQKVEKIMDAPEEAPEPVAATPQPLQAAVPPVPQAPAAGAPEPALAETTASIVPAASELKWHSFWNPFRSEIAAKGFVAQLEKVTGLDYRVVRIKTGVYQVAFAYENDFDRQTRLSQITAATGLELPGS